MNPAPLVSIITPSYNQGAFLEATIRSVLEQDYAEIEYILIDGGSTDRSLAIIQKYAQHLAYWVSEADRGQAHAINKGLQRAHGQILGWLNSDDLLLPGTVRAVVETFQRRPELDVVYGRLERIDAQGRLVPTPELPKDRQTFGRATVIGECIVNQPGCFWRRRVMEKCGTLDETLQYCMDYEYWIRMACQGAVFERLARPVARFRLSPGSKTVGHTAAHAVEQIGVLERTLAKPDLQQALGLASGEIAGQARRARARIALHAAYGYAKQRCFPAALRWLLVAVRNDPLSPFDRRWFDLARARLRRSLRA